MSQKTFALPKEFSHRSPWKALAGGLFTIALWLGSAGALALLWTSSASLFVKILGSLPLLMAGGYGILLAGFMGHDGTHFTLHDNKVVSSLLGIFMTAPITPYLLMGFTISHWNHHKFTNTEKDPDSALFSRFESLLSRALLARPFSFLEYGKTAIQLAFGLPLEQAYHFPLDAKTVQRLAQVNIAMNLGFAVLHGLVAFYYPPLFLGILAVLGAGSVLSGLSPFIEHTGTGQGRGHDTRTSSGWWWDFFILGNNYHLEHHLYPTVPFYHLKGVYEHLKAQGYYDEPRFVSHGVVDTYRYTLKAYPYPKYTEISKPSLP